MNLETIECGHAKCSCHVVAQAGENAFCSDYCRASEQAEEEEESCACGHPPCDVP